MKTQTQDLSVTPLWFGSSPLTDTQSIQLLATGQMCGVNGRASSCIPSVRARIAYRFTSGILTHSSRLSTTVTGKQLPAALWLGCWQVNGRQKNDFMIQLNGAIRKIYDPYLVKTQRFMLRHQQFVVKPLWNKSSEIRRQTKGDWLAARPPFLCQLMTWFQSAQWSSHKTRPSVAVLRHAADSLARKAMFISPMTHLGRIMK